ncbi:MAG: FAD-binding protein [Fimbriimonadaceae bacterium]|nr:FAD-binding protein [Fimbriimonadaceae bacterium]QYK54787.1 MAG: FAD-binding protein [Fimbriimonadaceae bacterium]
MRLLGIAFDANDARACQAFAAALGCEFDLVQLTGVAVADAGAGKVMDAGLEDVPPADALAAALQGATSGYTHVAAPSSMQAKDLLARLAGLLDAAMVTDATGFTAPNLWARPIVAGTVMATVETLTEPVVVTFRAASFAKVEPAGASPVEAFQIAGASAVTRLAKTVRGGSRPDLTQAKVVVSGGRPLGDAETFERVIGGLADKLGGAVGATRAAVDSGIAANELQVGQTGKIVAPDLYIAAGISGSTQHMAGIKDSKVIVAINKDSEAPIFEVADFGLVADLFDAVPELTSKV